MKSRLLLCLLFISGHLFSQEIMSEMKFTEYVLEEVSKSDQKLKVIKFDKLVLGSKFNNASYFHSLKSDYPKYKSKQQSLKSIVAEVIARIDSIYAPDVNYKIDTLKIVPVLKPKDFIKRVVTNDEGEVLYDSFNKDIVIVYVEDKDSGYNEYRYFSSQELDRIGYNKENLRVLSLRNLKA